MSQRLLSWTLFCTWLSSRRVVQEEEEGNLVRLTFDDGAVATLSSDKTDPTPGWSEVTPGSDGHLVPPRVMVEEPDPVPKKVAPSRASTASPEAPFGRNGGVVCDVRTGPCACGAWH